MSGRAVEGFVACEPPHVTHNDLEVRRSGSRSFVGKSDRLREAEAGIVARLRAIAPEDPLSGPVRASYAFCFEPAGGHSQGDPMTDRPDVDNLVKTFQDCCARVGIVTDDAHVCSMTADKAWSSPAGIWFRFEEVGDVE